MSRPTKTHDSIKYARFLAVTYTWVIDDDGVFAYQRDEAAAEARLDGLYVIRTSLPASDLDGPGTVRAYKRLSSVERTFRSLKDLKVRPVYHRTEPRVRTHVFLCMLAYYVEWHMRQKLKPMLFDDEDAEGVNVRAKTLLTKPGSGPASALGFDEDPVHHGDRAVTPDFKQQHFAGGGSPARQRLDVHIVGDQDNCLPGGQPEQEFPQFGRLRFGATAVPEERVERRQFLDRAQLEEPGRVAAAAPLTGENPIDAHTGSAGRSSDRPRLRPSPRIEIALGGAVVEGKGYGISGARRQGVAHDGHNAGLREAGKARVGGCRRPSGNKGGQQRGGEKQARPEHRPQSPANAINRPQMSAPGQQTIERAA